MTQSIEITPVAGPIRGSIRPPGSKSITNRAMICAALAEGKTLLTGALESEDTFVMAGALRRLGIMADNRGELGTIKIEGCGGKIAASHAGLYIANSGTSVRFLTALAAIGTGEFRLHGTARMHERPIHDLLDGLAQLGVQVESELHNGCPPVVVHAAGMVGGEAKIRGDVSSQFLSGLLMAAPYAKRAVELTVDGVLVSQPYVRLTLAVMKAFGVDVPAGDLQRFTIAPGGYVGLPNYAIEPDASAASYFFAAAAICGGEITVEGLSQNSLQGDIHFCDCLAKMGCTVKHDGNSTTIVGCEQLRGIDVDMNAISDTVQTLAAVALFADRPTTITGVGHIQHKETDRIGNLAIELRKFGADVEVLPDGLRISPPARGGKQTSLHGAEIETYDDHRMAMSLALVGLRVPHVRILNPNCTAKTYPKYFDDLARIVENSTK